MNASDDGSTAHDASVLLATAGYDHTIRFWDVLQGTCLATLQHNESVSVHAAHPRSLMSSTQQVNCMAISPDKRYLAVAGNPNVRLFGVQETLQTARSLQMDAAHLGANADSTQRAVSPEAAASTANIQAQYILQGHKGNVTAIGFQSAGHWLYTASLDGTIKIWDLRDSVEGHGTAGGGLKCQRDLTSRAGITRAMLHPNQAELVTGDETGVVRVWDLTRSMSTVELTPEDQVPISGVAISEDGDKLAVVNENGNLYVWLSKSSETASAGFVPFGRVRAVHHPYATKCLFSPNSQLLITTGSDGMSRIWTIDTDSQSIRPASVFQGHENWVWDAVFSADSSFLLTGASDRTARLWDVAAGDVVCVYSGHGKAITAVAMNDTLLPVAQ